MWAIAKAFEEGMGVEACVCLVGDFLRIRIPWGENHHFSPFEE